MVEGKPLKREFYCGLVNESLVGRQVTVYGWLENKRELGGLVFLDLRDCSGILQVALDRDNPALDIAKNIGREWVLRVSGRVLERTRPNPALASGRVEIVAEEIEVLAESEVPPIAQDQVSEELRLKYRYLDLRRSKMQENLRWRARIGLEIRQYLDRHGFIEVETPILSKATPEGARDYLVPSRVYPGRMFALPQSPQLFKQILMVAGCERYFQFSRCFRDEDLRADRQPEFTQIDLEMSFAEPAELWRLVEGMMEIAFASFKREIKVGAMTYAEAMSSYGSDKPDLRNPLRIRDFSRNTEILQAAPLNSVIETGEVLLGLVVPDDGTFSRKRLDSLTAGLRRQGGRGLFWLRHGEGTFRSSLGVPENLMAAFYEREKLPADSLLLLIGDCREKALLLAGRLREELGVGLIDEKDLAFTWVHDFPLFFYNEEEKRFESNHHPFTAPRTEDLPLLGEDPLAVRAVAYDLVLNGIEIGGGSRRINDPALQARIFSLLGLPEKETEEQFGFFLRALKLGAPPHLGIALGFDRLVMLACGEKSIRDAIAFPKTTSSLCLMSGSPTPVTGRQLADLGLQLSEK